MVCLQERKTARLSSVKQKIQISATQSFAMIFYFVLGFQVTAGIIWLTDTSKR